MTIFFGVLVIAAIGAALVVANGRGAAMVDTYDDRPDVEVPARGPLTGEDLREVRFSTALRGYRQDEVDALLARLADELERRPESGQPGRPPAPVSPEES